MTSTSPSASGGNGNEGPRGAGAIGSGAPEDAPEAKATAGAGASDMADRPMGVASRLGGRPPMGTPGADDKPGLPEGWRDPSIVEPSNERLSQLGDRRLRDVRAFEPRSSGAAWLKIGLMVVFLVAILIFHGQISDKAAGCFQQTAGLPTGAESVAPPKASVPPAGTNEVQIRIERQPGPQPR